MKVLFTFGGLPHYSNFILSRLNNIAGLEIIVVVPKRDTGTIGDGVMQTHEGVNFKIIYLKEYKAFYGNFFFKDFIAVLEEEKPNIIVTIWPYILGFASGIFLKKYLRKNNIKLILKEIPFHVSKFNNAYSYYKSKFSLQLNEELKQNEKVNWLFYVKHFILKHVRKYYYNKLVDATVNYIDEAYEIVGSYGVDREKIFISTNSPDTDLIFKANEEIKMLPPILKENPFRIVHIGRLVKWKKTHQLIQAIQLLKEKFPEIELLIIGKGKEQIVLELLAEELGVKENIKFIGGVYGNETLGRYLKASSVYVLAGMGGLSINQAMAFGKPIICSTADGTEKRLVKDKFNGFYFKDDDVNDLAEKIKTIISNNELKKLMGENSLSIIKEDVNVHKVIKEYVAAFNYVSGNSIAYKH
ncbi:MAG: glycosyltransferase family 1 protein [Bacteroidetes bacterium]|nr:MAG: glycosyltransferase family 1 protein [Bacteroidota bacterium]